MKKSVLLSCVLLGVLSICRGVTVSSGLEFMLAMDGEPDGEHVLVGDIDLTDLGYVGVLEFSGKLVGGGHVIRGLGSSSLVTSLSGEIDGVVLDGSVGGENTLVTFGSYLEYGLFAVTNCGGVIRNCEVRGFSLGNGGNRDQKVGFFAGVATEGARFENCVTREGCSVYVGINGYSGGIAGFVRAEGEYVGNVAVLSDCVNHAVTTKANSYNSGTGVGGILGGVMYGNDSCPTTRLERCTNYGAITFPSGNYLTGGGLVGKASNGMSHKTKGLTLELVDCANYGDVLSTKEDSGTVILGGMVGYLETSSASAYFTRCINRGNVSSASTTANSCAGGFVGQYKTPGVNRNMEAINSANYGNVSGTVAGGFLGKFDANVGWNCGKVLLYNCANYGVVSGETRGQFFGMGTSGTSAGVRLLFTNGWVPDSEMYVSSMKEPEIEGVWAPDMEGYSAEEAVRALNAQVTEENGYERWRVAESGYPELRIFAPPYKHTVIRVL